MPENNKASTNPIIWLNSLLQGFFSKIYDFLKLFPSYWPSLFALVLIYLFLWFSDQGQDIIFEYMSGGFLSAGGYWMFAIAIVYCLFNWYFTANNFNLDDSGAQSSNDSDKNHDPLKIFLPRYFGAATILIMGLSPIHVLAVQGWTDPIGHTHVTVLLGLLLFGLYFGHLYIDVTLNRLVNKRSKFLVILFALLLTFSPVILHNNQPDLSGFLSRLYQLSLIISPITLSLLVYGVIRYYKTYLLSTISIKPQIKRDIDSEESISLWTRIKWFYRPDNSSWVHLIIFIFSLIFTVLLLLWNIYPSSSTIAGPAIVLSVSVLFWVGLLNLFMYVIRSYWRSATYLFGVGIFLVLTVFYNLNKESRYAIDLGITEKLPNRIHLHEYTDRWLSDFVKDMPTDSTIYLVSSYGGGIRASYWTNLILAKYMDDKDKDFYNQVYSLTGASGGTVGVGLFFAMKEHNSEVASYGDYVETLYGKKDFLSPMIARMFGADAIRAFLPFDWLSEVPDRHQQLALQFGKQVAKFNIESLYDENLLNLYTPQTEKRPILMPTTAWSQRGVIGLYSPMHLDPLMNNGSVNLIDTIQTIHNSSTGITVGTSIFESARFPIASPPGSIKDGLQMVDAGFVDNLGAGTTIDLLEMLTDRIKYHGFQERVNIRVLVINSSSGANSEPNNTTPLFNPADSYFKLYGGKQSQLQDRISQQIRDLQNECFDINMYYQSFALNRKRKVKHKTITSTFPLGWYLSKNALEQMSERSEDIVIDSIDLPPIDQLYYVARCQDINLEDYDIVQLGFDSIQLTPRHPELASGRIETIDDQYSFEKLELPIPIDNRSTTPQSDLQRKLADKGVTLVIKSY